MSQITNEQTKLLAGALNTAATSCFTVGIATPFAGYLYDVGGFRTVVSIPTLVFGVIGWLLAAVALHSFARRALRGLKP